MSLYTIVFIFVTFLILVGIGLFGLLISKIDRWIDKKDRLGRENVYNPQKEKTSTKK